MRSHLYKCELTLGFKKRFQRAFQTAEALAQTRISPLHYDA